MNNTKHRIVKIKIPIFTILFLIFLTLKLTKIITWSWVWVTIPLWGVPAIILIIAIIFSFIGLLRKLF
jgi:hypothetical protein